jgi:hypothetical protein
MTMDEPRTCGEGLAQRSALPARVSALTAAMAEVLETHQQTLDLTDDNARAERIAYQQLANLVQCERDLAAVLETWSEEDQAMLVVSKESP